MEDYDKVELLLAEDNPLDAELTLRAIRKSGTHMRAYWVKDGAEALRFVFRQGEFSERDYLIPRFILLDVQMPFVGGLDVLRQLKQNPTTHEIATVLLVSSASDRDFLETQTFEYMVKPVTSEVFGLWVARVENAMAESRARWND